MSDKMVQFTALLFREKTKKLEQQIAAADTEIKKPIPYRGEKKKGFLSYDQLCQLCEQS